MANSVSVRRLCLVKAALLRALRDGPRSIPELVSRPGKIASAPVLRVALEGLVAEGLVRGERVSRASVRLNRTRDSQLRTYYRTTEYRLVIRRGRPRKLEGGGL